MASQLLPAAFLLLFTLSGCSGRPEQRVFLLQTSTSGQGSADVIADEVATALKLGKSVADFEGEGGAVAHKIELYGGGFSIFILSAADQQCYRPGPPRPITYERGLYDVVIAKTGFLPGRSRISEMAAELSARAARHRALLSDKKPDCPPSSLTFSSAAPR